MFDGETVQTSESTEVETELRGLCGGLSGFVGYGFMGQNEDIDNEYDQWNLHWLFPQLRRTFPPPIGKPCIFSIACSALALLTN